MSSNQTQNQAGEWVPAIPLPWYGPFGMLGCACEKTFWRKERYREHYAYEHIYLGRPA
jgi:hypothetical protein